ncbi:hypothetical protein NIES23_11650 [Trichormus variabilis NIES-23]|uniref:Uncharacterized protein n=1 Tax=Trichormus variabilis NIES-23 TaxID=1973479 RepID=A0A1Z4KHE8_ANAVA|nr:hypothetical protein NIES23_11650 [Trichormus variabilis NIES-23]
MKTKDKGFEQGYREGYKCLKPLHPYTRSQQKTWVRKSYLPEVKSFDTGLVQIFYNLTY